MKKHTNYKVAQGFTKTIADQVQHEQETKQRKEAEAKRLNTPEHKISVLRGKVNQVLTESNKKNPENRVKNTKDFVDLLSRFVVSDYNKLAKSKIKTGGLTIKELNEFVSFYSGHIQNLVLFDNEMVFCANPQCKNSMAELFLNNIQSQLPVLHSRFTSLVLKKSKQLDAIQTIREA